MNIYSWENKVRKPLAAGGGVLDPYEFKIIVTTTMKYVSYIFLLETNLDKRVNH